MKLFPFIFALTLLASCGSSDEREQNVVRVKFTNIDGVVADTNEKLNEYLKVIVKDGVLTLERVELDEHQSRFEFKGDIISRKSNGKRMDFWAKSHHGEDTDKISVFGIDTENKTVDSVYIDFGENYDDPKYRITVLYGDVRWEGK